MQCMDICGEKTAADTVLKPLCVCSDLAHWSEPLASRSVASLQYIHIVARSSCRLNTNSWC